MDFIHLPSDCVGHDAEGKPYEFERRSKPNAAGSLYTSIEGFTKFYCNLIKEKGLKESSYLELFRPQIRIRSRQQFGPGALIDTDEKDSIDLSYGLGFGLLKTRYGKAFFKEWHDDGWGHYSIGLPDRSASLILMSNSDNGERIFREILQSMGAGRPELPAF